MTRDLRFAVYADVNPNTIDGSAIWLQSMATVLSLIPRMRIDVVLKAREERDILTRPIRSLPGVTVHNPVADKRFAGPYLSHNQVLEYLEELDRAERFDGIILRGYPLCHTAAMRPDRPFAGRVWPYLTDIPQSYADIEETARVRISRIADIARFFLCQTEAFRTFMESCFPGVADKALVLPPMVPEAEARAPEPRPLAPSEPLKLTYVGKYAKLWNTYEMTQQVAGLRARGVNVELHMYGDKIHQEVKDEGFHDRMLDALEQTPGVHWHKGRSRQETMAALVDCHLALGWRHAALDDSLELSTKLLEYGIVGLPVIANRNPQHEELLGIDYPLFANSPAEFDAAVERALDATVRKQAAERCRSAAEQYTYARVAARLAPWIDRAVPPRAKKPRKLKVLVASHDLKFFTRIQEHLGALRGVELRIDHWPTISDHSKKDSEALLEWADVIICEWCTNNAIWYSQRKKPHQRLIIRLHRFELFRHYPTKLDFHRVDAVVFVGDYYRKEALDKLKWEAHKLTVIPNWVDTAQLNRPKHAGAEYRLGMIGIAPMRKRMDRGLEVLARLRRKDRRYQMYVKTKLPWEYPWIWSNVEEQEHFAQVFRRINSDPDLQGAVHFDNFGPDVPAWLRKIGWVLSTSDDESFHLAPAEGMASRALPMLLPWPGAEHIYPTEWVKPHEEAIADSIQNIVGDGSWSARGDEVRSFIDDRYSVESVCNAWERLVTDSPELG